MGLRHQPLDQRPGCVVAVDVQPRLRIVAAQVLVQRFARHALAEAVSNGGQVVEQEAVERIILRCGLVGFDGLGTESQWWALNTRKEVRHAEELQHPPGEVPQRAAGHLTLQLRERLLGGGPSIVLESTCPVLSRQRPSEEPGFAGEHETVLYKLPTHGELRGEQR